jgi:SAM-dependent methyltransferase
VPLFAWDTTRTMLPCTQGMNPAEFHNIAKSERDFWWYRGMREVVFRMLDPVIAQDTDAVGDLNVLEAGCGTGFFAKALEQRYGWRMTALDLGKEGLDYARSYKLRRLVQGDMTKLPFQAGSYDGLVSMDVVVHLSQGQEEAAFDEYFRVLKPEGLLVLRVSALNTLRSRHSMFAQERQRFTQGRLVDAVERAGFQVIRCTYANSLLLPIAWFKFRIWEPLTRAKPASGVRPVAGWLDDLLYLPLLWESKILGWGGNLPLGQSLILVARRAD